MKKWIFQILFLLMPVMAQAVMLPAPQPPQYLYRIDDRSPEDVFRAGFQPWMQPENPRAVDSLWWHISGEAVRDQRTVWVSSTTISALDFTLQDLARQRRGFPTTIWVYEHSSLLSSYSAVWALDDANAQLMDLPPSARDYSRIGRYSGYLQAYRRQDEWATRGSISPVFIRRAIEWSVESGVWRPTGVTRDNPIFSPTLLPAPQTDNPLTNTLPPIVTSPEEVNGYIIETVTEVDDLGHTYLGASFLNLGLSCVGAQGSLSNGMITKRSTNSASTEPTCDINDIQKVPSKSATTYPSKLAITTHDGLKWCFNPSNSVNFSSFTGFSLSLRVDSCTEDQQNKATMDRLGRITFYVDGINFCVTAPASVTEKKSQWDWISLEPCDMHNKNQQWNLYKGKIYLNGTTQYIQDWNYYAMFSQNQSGYDSTLDVDRMNKDFFQKTSAPQDYQSEIKLGWVWKGVTYYPTNAPVQPWSTIYGYRTYYDAKLGQFYMLTGKNTAFQPRSTPQLKCLRAKMIGNFRNPDWDWATWEDCNQRDTRGRAYSFSFSKTPTETLTSEKKTVKVNIKDANSNSLWSVGTGQNAGFFFTAKYDHSSNSTKVFEINATPYISPMYVYTTQKPSNQIK